MSAVYPATDPFRTALQIPAFERQFGYRHAFLAAGSCFAACITQRLTQNKLNLLPLPAGTVYNPLSLFELLTPCGPSEGVFSPRFFTESEGTHYSYAHSSKIWGASPAELKNALRHLHGATQQSVSQADVWLLTLGTAYVWEPADGGPPVANCHKQPASGFRKRMLSVNGITDAFAAMYQALPEKQRTIILTVSPVRHTRDTLPLNAVSKAVLRLACHTLQENYPSVQYFPASELLLDDLRDYRFYAPDLIHPSTQAEDYIWQKFTETCLTPETRSLMTQWNKLQAKLQHRPANPRSENHRRLLIQTLTDLQAMPAFLNLTPETEELRQRLSLFESV